MNGVGYDVFIRAQAEPFKNMAELQTVKHVEAIGIAVQAKTELETYAEKPNNWAAPMDWTVMMAELDALLKAFRGGVKKLMNCRDSLHNLQSQAKLAIANQKKNWHLEKNKITAYLDQNSIGTPATLRKAFGEIIYSNVAPPEPLNVPRLFDIPKLVWSDGDARDTFSSPILIPRPIQSLSGVEYNNGFEKACATHKAKIDQLVLEARARHIPKLTGKHPCIMGVLPDSVEEFPFNGEFASPLNIFTPIKCPVLCVTKRVMIQDLHLISNCLRAHPMVFRCFIGRVVVLLVPPRKVLGAYGLRELVQGSQP